MQLFYRPNHSKGFTLIEISIGLVIIGLLIGGIVMGKSMIEAAELRGLLSQLDKIDTAINSFKTKYNCLPGDCATATNFFPSGGCPDGDGDSSTTCNGDGSGYIHHYGSNTDQRQLEHLVFWQHLALGGLIEGEYTGVGGGQNRDAEIGINVPGTPIKGLGISVYNHLGYETAWRSSLFGVDRGMSVHLLFLGAESSGWPTWGGKLTVQQSMSLDQKFDDGLANSGKFGVIRGIGGSYNNTGSTNGAAPNYSYSTDMGALCSALMIRNW